MLKPNVNVAVAQGAKRRIILLFVLCSMSFAEVRAQDVLSVGPMLHFNFGEKKPKLSWGVEAALWWIQGSAPVSVNIGFDRRKGSTVLFAQGQTGIGFLGIAAGPYLHLHEGQASVGFQTDYWINYFAGLNYRIRYGEGSKQRALGLYAKAPLPLKTNGEENRNIFDWDWD